MQLLWHAVYKQFYSDSTVVPDKMVDQYVKWCQIIAERERNKSRKKFRGPAGTYFSLSLQLFDIHQHLLLLTVTNTYLSCKNDVEHQPNCAPLKIG